jgi:hypothetical protein
VVPRVGLDAVQCRESNLGVATRSPSLYRLCYPDSQVNLDITLFPSSFRKWSVCTDSQYDGKSIHDLPVIRLVHSYVPYANNAYRCFEYENGITKGITLLIDRFCGLVVRIPGYTFRNPGYDSRRYQIL